MPLVQNSIKILLIMLFFFLLALHTDAGIVDELKNKISDKADSIEKLEKEIKRYKGELDTIAKEKNSLKRTIKRLDITRKKISTDIKITSSKIDKSNFNIEKLELEIGEKSEQISEQQETLANSIRTINEIDERSLVELVLASDNISTVWGYVDRLESFQGGIKKRISILKTSKNDLQNKQEKLRKEKSKLIYLKDKYEDQKKIADQNRYEKNRLLKQTKNKESNYKNLLKKKEALKKQFEQELLDFESQLQFALDPSRLPPEGSRVLSWPLDSIYVTQQFGYTEGGKRLYKRGWHNGVDLRARTPLPIKSPASGVVVGTGNTDLTCRGASFGKWVLIRHYNGLSSLFAHMSLIKVNKGQKLNTGDVVGYSGNTGYSTAPHLHMGLYASDGVSVRQLKSKACGGKVYTLPLAAYSAYLDPLAYLPRIQ